MKELTQRQIKLLINSINYSITDVKRKKLNHTDTSCEHHTEALDSLETTELNYKEIKEYLLKITHFE